MPQLEHIEAIETPVEYLAILLEIMCLRNSCPRIQSPEIKKARL